MFRASWTSFNSSIPGNCQTVDREEHTIALVNKIESPPKIDVFLLWIEREMGSEDGGSEDGGWVGWAHTKGKFSLLVFDFIGVSKFETWQFRDISTLVKFYLKQGGG